MLIPGWGKVMQTAPVRFPVFKGCSLHVGTASEAGCWSHWLSLSWHGCQSKSLHSQSSQLCLGADRSRGLSWGLWRALCCAMPWETTQHGLGSRQAVRPETV